MLVERQELDMVIACAIIKILIYTNWNQELGF